MPDIFSQKLDQRIEYKPEDAYTVPDGLFGFEGEKSFLLVQTDNVKPFFWFQSTASDWLAFLVCDPRIFRPDYQLAPAPDQLKELDLAGEEDSFVFVILNVPGGDIRRMTANLQGPLVFNMRNHRVKQLVVEGADLKCPVFPAELAGA